MLWLCIMVPAGVSSAAKPMQVLYLRIGSPFRMSLAAAL